MAHWLGTKRIAFLPVSRPSFDLPGSLVGAAWQQQIQSRIYYWPDALRGVDVSLRNYIQTISQGRADIEGVVQEMYTLDRRDVPPDFLASQFEQSFRDQGFDAAALVMNGGQGAGTSTAPGYWARFAMAEGVGVWAMELTHVLCLYMDLYTNDRPHDLNNYDNMDCSCGTHPTAYTKVQLGWLDPSAIVVDSARSSQFDLHTLGLVQPPPPGRVTAVQINAGGNPLFVEARQRVDQYDGGNQWNWNASLNVGGIPNEGVIVYELAGVENPSTPFPGEVDPLIRLLTQAALVPGQSITSSSGVTVEVTGALMGGFSVSIVTKGWASFFRIDSGFAESRSAVAVIARNPDHLDLFVIAADGGVYSAYWDDASGWSLFFRTDAAFATTGNTSVASIARNPDHIDLFVSGKDGGVYSAYWDSASGWSSFFRVDATFATTGEASVTVVARNPDHLDLFVTAADGGIYSAYWDGASGWSSFFRVDASFSTTAGNSVTAIARNPDHLDLFVTGGDGGIYSAYWDSASGWSSFFRVDVAFATAVGTSVTGIARNPDHLDLFVTAANGGIHSAYWDSASGWSSFFRVDAAFATAAGASVAAIARNPNHLDLFVTGSDGGIYSAYWDSTDGWSSFFRFDSGFAKGRSSVAVIARNPDHMDLFVTGNDGGIYSAYWDGA
jgi:hypothetical protein